MAYKYKSNRASTTDFSKGIINDTDFKITNMFANTKDFKDLTRILGVYLDNAIEASVLSEKKQLGIEIYKVKNDIEIIISNTYSNKVDKDKIGNERYSTKGLTRGHGLLLVKRILKNNNRLTSEAKITDAIYSQTIKIKEK